MQTIELDCPPGEPRPDDLIDGVLQGTPSMRSSGRGSPGGQSSSMVCMAALRGSGSPPDRSRPEHVERGAGLLVLGVVPARDQPEGRDATPLRVARVEVT